MNSKISLILVVLAVPAMASHAFNILQEAQQPLHRPSITIRYNITCPRMRGFHYHMWMYTRPLEMTIIDVTNGYTVTNEHGQMRAMVPDRKPSDVRVGLAIQHNCNPGGESKIADEEVGTCGILEKSCTFYFSANLRELKNFMTGDWNA